MGRPRKIVEETSQEEVVMDTVETSKVPAILPIAVDFGREDLNSLARKLNEVIAYVTR